MRKIVPFLLCFSILAVAQAAVAGDIRKEAADRFDRGLRLFNEGDNPGALLEFKSAYQLSGEPSILVNVGLVYAEMGRPVDAVEALDKALARPAGIPEAQVERARRVRDEQSARIGRLLITTNVPAQIEIDNLVVGRTPMPAPIPVASGLRLLAVVAPGQVPVHQEVGIVSGQQTDVAVQLLPLQGALAHLMVRASLPGADVVVDGKLVGRTPMPTSLALPPGRHEVTLRRPGYRATPVDITLADGSTGEIAIEAAENPAEAAMVGGHIELDINQADANISIDGVPRFRGDLTLPAGPHRLTVARAGFLPVERELIVDQGHSKTVRVELQPTEETRATYTHRVSAQRRNAWITIASGAVVAGVGTYMIVHAQSKQRSADDAQAELQKSLSPPTGECYHVPGSTAFTQAQVDYCQAKSDKANSLGNNTKVWKWAGWATAGVGGAAIVTGVILRIVADDMKKVTVASGTQLQPFAWTQPQGGGFGILGRF
jgi:hypothetical protein